MQYANIILQIHTTVVARVWEDYIFWLDYGNNESVVPYNKTNLNGIELGRDSSIGHITTHTIWIIRPCSNATLDHFGCLFGNRMLANKSREIVLMRNLLRIVRVVCVWIVFYSWLDSNNKIKLKKKIVEFRSTNRTFLVNFVNVGLSERIFFPGIDLSGISSKPTTFFKIKRPNHFYTTPSRQTVNKLYFFCFRWQ